MKQWQPLEELFELYLPSAATEKLSLPNQLIKASVNIKNIKQMTNIDKQLDFSVLCPSFVFSCMFFIPHLSESVICSFFHISVNLQK